MNFSKINNLDVGNGPGCRVSVFVSGCDHHCKNCFNPETWAFSYGEPFTDQVITQIINYAEPAYISGLSILGGEPLHPQNRESVLKLVSDFKKLFPYKTVWVWTGYLFEEVHDVLADSEIDVVVDGKFVEELKDLRLKYKGSSNQRVIDVKASKENKGVILYET